MKLRMDFKADWHAILKAEMASSFGMDVASVGPDAPVLFFNAVQRRVSPRPRIVYLSDTFSCPEKLVRGWDKLKKKFEAGEDLTAHLSKLVVKTKRTDQMLNDWGIHHFHLGEEVKQGWVERTGELLFARVTQDAIYVVGLYDHGDWVDDTIVETVHRNWPDSISQWKMNGTKGDSLTPDQRGSLRKKKLNAFFTTRDGTTYGPLGGGVTFTGQNIMAIVEMDKFHDFLERLELALVDIAQIIEPHLRLRGYQGTEEVEATLKLPKGYFAAFFPAYGVMINFHPREEGAGGISP